MQLKVLFIALPLTLALMACNSSTPSTGHQNPPGMDTAAFTNSRPVYVDALAAGWQNWSWNTTINFAGASPVQAGTRAMQVTFNSAWAGLYLHTDTGIDSTKVDTLRLWVHGGTAGGQTARVVLEIGGVLLDKAYTFKATANTWTLLEIPTSTLGASGMITGLAVQDTLGKAQPAFYLDEVLFYQKGPVQPPADFVLNVDAALGRKPISPNIYGISFAGETLAKDLKLPVRRWGGNRTSRFNYKVDADATASDWYFEGYPVANSNPGILPKGNAVDLFVQQDRRTGTASLITVPMIGYVTRDRNITCGFSVKKYGAQQAVDPWHPDCGNGVKPDGTFITGNNPLDTSVAVNSAFVQGWITHLTQTFGKASAGGVKYYNLDNEPMLWNSTHRDVHPQPLGYDELLNKTIDYGSKIKAVDPAAQLLGPAEWGWTNYFYSARDAAAGGDWWNTRPDRKAHGDMELVAWYLQKLKAYETTNGKRLLDYLDLHYYPQSGVYNSDVSASARAKRLRSTRSLWDSTYTDESWIADRVNLIPRMKQWVNTYYPGTRLAIGEYNFGAPDHINGAVAQADVLGIFAREGVDMAVLWGTTFLNQGDAGYDPDRTPITYAMRMYRNYDGLGGAFGDTYVQSTSADQSKVAVYAAERVSDKAVTVMLVNKQEVAQTVVLQTRNVTATNAKVYQYTAASPKAIVAKPNLTLSAGKVSTSLPASSITLLVIK
ncbi:glycoside hydrolase family 44 protein [Deinococcus cellulosilyticus]|uniref:Glycoside hydrolase family 44 catalytic domain-containing protein n=1 Tax=Deinococcus cellulosilyticus (strain DSM 18568 / NBRC 106333 / KACC 11606 / 5516J-15) TaxID=1223518 RepID=A0A511N1J1_DEIC1|nr:glycoside hydrolase family 44 protein [Deinococcus cellulosilyticus]GEM46760.1 hypothetical protein DC3_23950 [Deinococcus cellulosilyticus NBRC 106333 = KACC 11606]